MSLIYIPRRKKAAGGGQFLTGVAYDPYWANVSALLHADGANNSTAFVDEKGAAINRIGTTVALQTAQSKFGGSSIGGISDTSYLEIPYNSNLICDAQDFTAECWIYPTSVPNSMTVMQIGSSCNGSVPNWALSILNTGVVNVFAAAAPTTDSALYASANSTNVVTLNAWNHLAFVKHGSTIYCFLNGNLEASTSLTFTPSGDSSTGLRIGNRFPSNPCAISYLNGYIDEVRVTKGVARYTSSFSVPTASFPDANTIDYFWDNTMAVMTMDTGVADARGHATSLNGSALIQSTTKKYGAGALQATSGSISGAVIATDQYLKMGATDFTMELWVYPTACSSAGNSYLIGQNPQYAGSWPRTVYIYLTATTWNLAAVWDSSSSTDSLSGGSVTPNTWNHVALVKQGAVFSMYVNGVRVATKTSSVTTLKSTLDAYRVGFYSDSLTYLNGYYDDVRITMAARYSGPRITTPSAAQLVPYGNDLYWKYVSSLVKGDGTDGSTTIVDSAGLTWTAYGGCTLSTTNPKYGTACLNFTGTAYCYSSAPTKAIGTSDFTLEFWMNMSTLATYVCVVDGVSTNNLTVFVNGTSNPTLAVYLANGATPYSFASSGIAANTWYHVALVRKNGVLSAYVNGLQLGSLAASVSIQAQGILLGQQHTGSAYQFTGQIDEFRLTTGVARYPGNFLPPTIYPASN